MAAHLHALLLGQWRMTHAHLRRRLGVIRRLPTWDDALDLDRPDPPFLASDTLNTVDEYHTTTSIGGAEWGGSPSLYLGIYMRRNVRSAWSFLRTIYDSIIDGDQGTLG